MYTAGKYYIVMKRNVRYIPTLNLKGIKQFNADAGSH